MALTDQVRAARQFGLRYVDPNQPGIGRRRKGRAFVYRRADGRPLTNRSHLKRIEALVIPPAWQNVWICPTANGHIQATGFDQRGRRQYRYHDQWTAERNLGKFESLLDFARALPGIRARVAQDLKRNDLARPRIAACVVHLLDQALIRVGNDEYARDNNSFGLTTIRNHHVTVNGSAIRFRFKAKSGKAFEASVNDRRVARIVRRCQDLPGQQLFEYLDDAGRHRDISSEHINEYLAEITGARFTAKDFRTWGGTVAAAQALFECGEPSNPGKSLSQAEMKRRCTIAIKAAAEALGNTVTVCRQSYVHPRLMAAYAAGRLPRAIASARRNRKPTRLSMTERAVLRLLSDRRRR